jgi:hypothetical protein
MAAGEVVALCDGIVLEPGTEREERLTWAEARTRGVRVSSPEIQSAIDNAAPVDGVVDRAS